MKDLSDRKYLKTLRAELQTLLDSHGAEGLNISLGNCSFEREGDRCSFKLNIERDGAESKEARAFGDWFDDMEGLEVACGLTAAALGKTFQSNGRTFKVSGFLPRSSKRPILATEQGGKTCRDYKFSIKDVARLLAK